MRPNKRYVWPILAWITGGLLALVSWLGYLTEFVDERWEDFVISATILVIFSAAGTISAGVSQLTYTKKPRGWRKLRRDAEREAYIKQLEKEAGL